MFLLSSVLVACFLTKATIASFAGSESGWHGVSSYGPTGQNINIHQNLDYSSYENGGDFHTGMSHEINSGNIQQMVVQSVPISEHIEVTKPVVVPIVKNIGVPVAQPVAIPVPHPVAVTVAQPYPVHVPIAHPIPVPVVKTIAIPVEKKVPYAVEKIIPVPVEKPVPVTVEKHIPVPVEKPYPIHIPIYKHVFHRKTKEYGHWRKVL